jgi:hypothetical protein
MIRNIKIFKMDKGGLNRIMFSQLEGKKLWRRYLNSLGEIAWRFFQKPKKPGFAKFRRIALRSFIRKVSLKQK